MKYVKLLVQKVVKHKAFQLSLVAALGLSYLALAFKASDIHADILTATAGESVYQVLNDQKGWVGSAFSFRKDGEVYTVTNNHVCDVFAESSVVILKNEYNGKFISNIKYRSKRYDLCLLQTPVNDFGLKLAKTTYVGESVWALGHPLGWPLTLSTPGRVINLIEIAVPGVQCHQDSDPNFFFKQIVPGLFDIPVEVCTLKTNALQTTTPIDFGSSGSPLINFYGNVVGVNFMKDRANFSKAIPKETLILFIDEEVNVKK